MAYSVSLEPSKKPPRPPRDWIAIIVTALPGIAALIAIAFTYPTINATKNQVEIAKTRRRSPDKGRTPPNRGRSLTVTTPQSPTLGPDLSISGLGASTPSSA